MAVQAWKHEQTAANNSARQLGQGKRGALELDVRKVLIEEQ